MVDFSSMCAKSEDTHNICAMQCSNHRATGTAENIASIKYLVTLHTTDNELFLFTLFKGEILYIEGPDCNYLLKYEHKKYIHINIFTVQTFLQINIQ